MKLNQIAKDEEGIREAHQLLCDIGAYSRDYSATLEYHRQFVPDSENMDIVRTLKERIKTQKEEPGHKVTEDLKKTGTPPSYESVIKLLQPPSLEQIADAMGITVKSLKEDFLR